MSGFFGRWCLALSAVGAIIIPHATVGRPILNATPQDLAASLQATERADARVARIAYRINTSNQDLCPSPGLTPGWTLQAANQYPASVRSWAMRYFGMANHVTVEVVVPAGPADLAGLRRGDGIVAIGNKFMPDVDSASRSTSYMPVQTVLDALDSSAARASSVTLTITRDGTPLTIRLPVNRGCAIRAQLVPENAANSYADDRYATITTALETRLQDDDELAIAVGHEMAHAYLRHQAMLRRKGFARSLLGNLGVAPAIVRRTERQADYVGLYLAARAGFDVTKTAEMWRDLGGGPQSQDGGFLAYHPSVTQRIEAAQATVREIDAKRKAGLVLMPDTAELR